MRRGPEALAFNLGSLGGLGAPAFGLPDVGSRAKSWYMRYPPMKGHGPSLSVRFIGERNR